ncbi:MAG: hypothetical protein ACW99U_11050 [Candidatus Thorarchaeota archaeon]|jgi:hypothetical protein
MKWSILQEPNLRPAVNIYTIAHFLTGLMVGFLGVSAKYAVVIVVLWEVIEQGVLVPLRVTWPPELLLDSIVDIILGLFGYLIGRLIHSKVKDTEWFPKYFDIFGKDDAGKRAIPSVGVDAIYATSDVAIRLLAALETEIKQNEPLNIFNAKHIFRIGHRVK